MKRLRKRLFWKEAAVFVLVIFLTPPFIFSESQENTGRRQFMDVLELSRLIEAGREAGYADEDLKTRENENGYKTGGLFLTGDGKKINVWKYLKEQEELRKNQRAEIQKTLNKKYLTVQDILADLVELESQTLSSFRDELLHRAEEF